MTLPTASADRGASILLNQSQRTDLIAALFARNADANPRSITPEFVGRLAVISDEDLLDRWQAYESDGDDQAIELLARLGLSRLSVEVVFRIAGRHHDDPQVVALRLSSAQLRDYAVEHAVVKEFPTFGSMSMDLREPPRFGGGELRPGNLLAASAVLQTAGDGTAAVSFAFEAAFEGQLDRTIATARHALADVLGQVEKAVAANEERVCIDCEDERAEHFFPSAGDTVAAGPAQRGG
jgi:hypothetical protein